MPAGFPAPRAPLERSVPLTSLPNLLTLSRILVIPLVIATFYLAGDSARWLGCALFSAASSTAKEKPISRRSYSISSANET